MTSLSDFTSRPFCYLFLLRMSWKQRGFFVKYLSMLPNILSLKKLFNEIKPVAYSEFLECLGSREGPFFCEVLIDATKHSFPEKFI